MWPSWGKPRDHARALMTCAERRPCHNSSELRYLAVGSALKTGPGRDKSFRSQRIASERSGMAAQMSQFPVHVMAQLDE